jgi:hypothetical protein
MWFSVGAIIMYLVFADIHFYTLFTKVRSPKYKLYIVLVVAAVFIGSFMEENGPVPVTTSTPPTPTPS